MKAVRWKNFLSTGNNFTEIKLNKHKTTSISGENGSGKTSMLDAIVFALFGKAYRNINIPQLPNSINKKDCMVELYFNIGENEYKIRRGLAPKIFEIYKNKILIDQDSKSKDYQRMLEEQILRMNYKSFCQVVILGSTNYIPFMRLTAAERRSVVENLLDINVFSTMNTLLKGKKSLLNEQLRVIEGKMEILKEKIDLQKDHVKLMENQKIKKEQETGNKQKELNDKKNKLSSEIEILEKNIEENLNKILHKDKEQNVLNTLTSDLLLLSKSISKIEKEINSIEKLSTCFVCSQDVDDEVKEKLKLTKIQELDKQNKDFSTIEESLSKLKEKIKKYDDIQEILKKDRSELSEAKASIRAIDQQLNDIKVSVTDIAQEEIDALKQKMNIYIDQGKELIKEKQEIKDNLHYYKIALYLLKDSGIKSKIIKHYLPIMNKVINRYLSEMNFFVQFELDEEFKETIKSRNRDIFSYENFSEGEKRKIDLALLFAWRKISQVKNSLNCNLLIFDEILDGSLDDNATKLLLSILEMIDNDSNIFVISHKSKDILQDKFENNIMFKKKKNFSKISHD
jgi:DNA repair exonuclease SbcCD ATPase subunit